MRAWTRWTMTSSTTVEPSPTTARKLRSVALSGSQRRSTGRSAGLRARQIPPGKDFLAVARCVDQDKPFAPIWLVEGDVPPDGAAERIPHRAQRSSAGADMSSATTAAYAGTR